MEDLSTLASRSEQPVWQEASWQGAGVAVGCGVTVGRGVSVGAGVTVFVGVIEAVAVAGAKDSGIRLAGQHRQAMVTNEVAVRIPIKGCFKGNLQQVTFSL